MRESIARVSGAVGLSAGTLLLLLSGGAASAQDQSLVERGRYLTILADCTACHTNTTGGGAFAGGRPIETPFGKLLSANITPDTESGIGAWSDNEFDAAVRGGRRPDGSRLYPAMPYTYYARMSHEDTLAIRAYLKTVKPVHAEVETNQLPFPFNIRADMVVWDGLFFAEGEHKPDPARSGEWNRGAFLVEGPGHCGACHTPKNLLGADKTTSALKGNAQQGWFAPDLNDNAQQGLHDWSKDDLVAYLKSGHNRFAAAAGPMAEEVTNSSSHMNDADLQAIAIYLKGRASESESIAPLAHTDPQLLAGRAIYVDLCSACHKADGAGIPQLIPNIAASASVASRDASSVLHVIIRGAPSAATDSEPTAAAMPGFGDQLTNVQIAAVANYIRNSWGHAAEALTARDVSRQRTTLAAAIPTDDQ